jgi:hypothetical protein
MSQIASTTQGPGAAIRVSYDNTTSGLTAVNVQAALDEIYVISSTEQFSHNVVDSNLTIPLKRQMVVVGEIEIENGFELNVLGELALVA